MNLGVRLLPFESGTNDSVGQSQPLQHFDVVISRIEFPPLVLDRSTRGIVMMVVVPTFTARKQGDQPVVATLLARLVRLVAKIMGE